MPSLRPSALMFAFIALTSVTAQTFQYSRGWTNGKRDGHKINVEMREMANNLERVLTPCQMSKLKYVLEGKLFNERLIGPCDYSDDDNDPTKRQYKPDHSPDPLFDAFL